MHQKRQAVNKKIPIPRKGTAYVARPLSHLKDSVPVVIAVRDMLHLARTAREVKQMTKQKLLKINGKEVRDIRESIRLFNIFEADKTYALILTATGRFALEETDSKKRVCKVLNKTLASGGKIQLNLHDGSNILSEDKINTQDTVILDEKGKLSKHIPFEKGRKCIIISGKYLGRKGEIISIENKKAQIRIDGIEKEAVLERRNVIAL